MSFADDLRKKADDSPKEDYYAETKFMNEIYASMKEGVVKSFFKYCYNAASYGQGGAAAIIDFMNIVAIICQQEKVIVRESDYAYVRHVLKFNKKDLTEYIKTKLTENGMKNVKVNIKANAINGYYIKLKAEW